MDLRSYFLNLLLLRRLADDIRKNWDQLWTPLLVCQLHILQESPFLRGFNYFTWLLQVSFMKFHFCSSRSLRQTPSKQAYPMEVKTDYWSLASNTDRAQDKAASPCPICTTSEQQSENGQMWQRLGTGCSHRWIRAPCCRCCVLPLLLAREILRSLYR